MENNEYSRIYLAGGCFWGMERFMSALPGVETVTSGYANSMVANPSYEEVCRGRTGAQETVCVAYDPAAVSLATLIYAYFSVIDTTMINGQGPDRGSQYQTGIFYQNDADRQVIQAVSAVERRRREAFHVILKELENFYPAEAYHQQYLTKNPRGYCHISPQAIVRASSLWIDAAPYVYPDEEELRQKLTAIQYDITQNHGTEPPFHNEYWNTFDSGVYVDVVTGEPLFLSVDKFSCTCGWPSFSRPVDENVIVERRDTSAGMVRTEVTSRTGASHLGHVFFGEGLTETDRRYCIDSGALRFIPYKELEAAGYGFLKSHLERT